MLAKLFSTAVYTLLEKVSPPLLNTVAKIEKIIVNKIKNKNAFNNRRIFIQIIYYYQYTLNAII